MAELHQVSDLINIFNDSFAQSFNTRLVLGNDEPIYLPPNASDIGIKAQPFAQVVFAHGFYASALHEIAHWCLAGEERRKQVDFGYWYAPDGRTQAQQLAFEKVEIKPQAIEWALCLSAGFAFNVSCDNINGDEFGQQPDRHVFQQAIFEQVESYLQKGFPPRATYLMGQLARFYQTEVPCRAEDFIFDSSVSSSNKQVAA